jgi:ribulose bisphosphate carboxylase small subunit
MSDGNRPVLDWSTPLAPLVAELEDTDMRPYKHLALSVVRQACVDFTRYDRARGLASLEEWLRSEHAAVYLEVLGIGSAVRERVIETILAKVVLGEVDKILAAATSLEEVEA